MKPLQVRSAGADAAWAPTTGPAGGTHRQTTALRRSCRSAAAWLPRALAIPFAFLLFASVGPVLDQAVGSFFNWYDELPVSFAGFRYYSEMLGDFAAPGSHRAHRHLRRHHRAHRGRARPRWRLARLPGAAGAVGPDDAVRAPARDPLVVGGAALFECTLSATSGFDGAINHLIG